MKRRATGVALLVLGLAAVGCRSDVTYPGSTAVPTSITDSPRPSYPAPAKISWSSGSLLVFGDSWTYGLKATPITNGFAYLTAATLGLKPDVHGVGGTGYLTAGPDGEGTYAQRLATLATQPRPALIIIQGGTNDVGHSTAEVKAAAESLYQGFEAKFAGVPIVVVGTGTSDPRLNVFGPVDEGTREAAGELGLNYISPLEEKWFTIENADRTIKDPTDSPHPSNYGHQLFADRLVEDLLAIKQ